MINVNLTGFDGYNVRNDKLREGMMKIFNFNLVS